MTTQKKEEEKRNGIESAVIGGIPIIKMFEMRNQRIAAMLYGRLTQKKNKSHFFFGAAVICDCRRL